MSGACVRRARLQACDGAPMPTKQTSSFLSARAAATAIISAVEYSNGCSSFENMLLHPGQEGSPIARDRIPGSVEGVVAPVVAVGIRRTSATRRDGDGADRPVRQNDRIGTGRPQIVHDLFDGDERPPRR